MLTTIEKNLSDYVKIFRYDLSDEAEAIAGLTGWQKHSWYNSATGESHSEDHKELDVRSIADHPAVFSRLTECLIDAVKQYVGLCFNHAQLTSLSDVRLNRYNTGSLMRAHCDHIHSLFDGQVKGIPAVSLLGVLNDDFTGGDLILCGKTYRPQPGEIMVWPSCFLYPHEVTEVTSGTRYSFVSWAW